MHFNGSVLVAGFLLTATGAQSMPLISEVFYDALGSDSGKVFVELYGSPGASLAGHTLEAVNGDNGAVHAVAELSGVFGSSGFFVVADTRSDGTSDVSPADLLIEFDPQNGPDSVRLLEGATVLDAVGFGVFAPGQVFAGEGAPAEDAVGGESLSRAFANVDTGDNSVDFVRGAPSPGVGLTTVPEPGSALLAMMGLLGLASFRRSRAA